MGSYIDIIALNGVMARNGDVSSCSKPRRRPLPVGASLWEASKEDR